MFNKSFWKYFISTIKESKWLLIKYIIVGLYLIITGIIANRLNLNDLTYYNAMMTVLFLGEMIAFGFSEGFGIYINQNINEPEKSKNYAKIGFVFVSIYAIFITTIFAIFPKFILKNILNLEFDVSLTFYYLMVAVMFFNTIFSYYSNLLKKVGEFKIQTINTIIQSVLIVAILIILLAAKKLFLVPIGILFLISYIFCCIYSHIALLKNKTYKVNLFKLKNLKLTKQEFKIVTERTLSEVVWEIGYFFISLFILKVDVITYNQYCYFENVLDILNGVFFAFINVVAIKICRCIGEEKQEEAYSHGINSLKSTFVIWFIYAIISISLFVPLKLGMNEELQSTAFLSLILFLTISLFRFLEWNLGTYILGQSDHFAKLGLILETVFTCYWITMFLIAELIPANIFMIYSLIAAENITKTIISFVVFKKKKWLKKAD